MFSSGKQRKLGDGKICNFYSSSRVEKFNKSRSKHQRDKKGYEVSVEGQFIALGVTERKILGWILQEGTRGIILGQQREQYNGVFCENGYRFSSSIKTANFLSR